MTLKFKLWRTKGRLNNFLARKCWSSYSTMTSICLVVVAVMKSVVKCPSYLGNDELSPSLLSLSI